MTEQYDMSKKYYENHPAADIFPMMDRTTFFDLVEDIRVNGQIEPIIMCNDLILDGRNRYAACVHLGIEPKFREYQGDPDKVVDYVVSLNLKRRHLDTSQRAMVAAKLANLPKGRPEINPHKCGLKQEDAARILNVSERSIQNAQKVINEGAPELVAACVSGDIPVTTAAAMVSKPVEEQQAVVSMVKSGMEPKSALREIKAEQAKRSLEEAKASISEERKRDIEAVCDMRVCSCGELFASGIKPDVVITDPPYPSEFLPCFTVLAECCEAAGVPLVAVMAGQSYLPEVIDRLSRRLKYRWTMAYLTPGGQAVQQWQAKVNTAWKPVLLFGESEDWFGDVATSKPNDNDKRFHEWGQSESGFADLVSRLTKPGQTICDPFMGAGTTAVVSLAMGRKFVGCDINPEHVETAKLRVQA